MFYRLGVRGLGHGLDQRRAKPSILFKLPIPLPDGQIGSLDKPANAYVPCVSIPALTNGVKLTFGP